MAGIAILVAVALVLLACIGDLVPGLIFLGVTTAVTVLSRGHHGDLSALVVATLGIFVAAAYKALRRSRRGRKGGRLP